MKEITNCSELQDATFALVDFWSPTCGPCRAMRPVIENLENDYPELKFFACNILKGGEMAQRFGVDMLPTILILLKGRVVYRNTGVIKSESLAEKIDELIEENVDELLESED